MYRRVFVANGIGVFAGLAVGSCLRSGVVATDSTPESDEDIPSCDLDLDAADFSVSLLIPGSVPEDAFGGIEQTLRSRIGALGWSSCSVDRYGREILVNVQSPSEPESPATDELLALLSEPGRIDLVDGGEGAIEIGDRIVTTPLPPDSPEINVVYTTIVSNQDFTSVTLETTDYGQDVIRFDVSPEGADRLAEFTRNNVGLQMPLVIDGIVVANPMVQTEISDTFDLQMSEPDLNDRIVVFGSALPYPERLVVGQYRDIRDTPEA